MGGRLYDGYHFRVRVSCHRSQGLGFGFKCLGERKVG